jgi:hypothetical protein
VLRVRVDAGGVLTVFAVLFSLFAAGCCLHSGHRVPGVAGSCAGPRSSRDRHKGDARCRQGSVAGLWMPEEQQQQVSVARSVRATRSAQQQQQQQGSVAGDCAPGLQRSSSSSSMACLAAHRWRCVSVVCVCLESACHVAACGHECLCLCVWRPCSIREHVMSWGSVGGQGGVDGIGRVLSSCRQQVARACVLAGAQHHPLGLPQVVPFHSYCS